jgi:hypothetical protein
VKEVAVTAFDGARWATLDVFALAAFGHALVDG